MQYEVRFSHSNLYFSSKIFYWVYITFWVTLLTYYSFIFFNPRELQTLEWSIYYSIQYFIIKRTVFYLHFEDLRFWKAFKEYLESHSWSIISLHLILLSFFQSNFRNKLASQERSSNRTENFGIYRIYILKNLENTLQVHLNSHLRLSRAEIYKKWGSSKDL